MFDLVIAYSAIWTINVHGIREFKYANEANSNEPLKNGNESFNSGTIVNLANPSRDEKGVGIISTRGTTYYDGVAGYISSGTVDVNIDGKYIKFDNSTKTNQEWFEDTSSIEFTVSYVNDMATDETSQKLEVTLPKVPSSDPNAPESYLVVYKVKFTYLGYSTEYFYVSYLVVNYATVTPTNSNSSVDLDTDLVDVGSSTTFLELFYYKEDWASKVDGKIEIDKATCDGCSVCIQVCKYGALEVEK